MVVLAAQPPLVPWQAANLEHGLVVFAQMTDQASAVVARALNRPDASAARVPLRESERLCVAATVRSNGSLRQDRPAWGGDDRQHVLIQVRVDTDHVIHLACNHPARSSGFVRRVR